MSSNHETFVKIESNFPLEPRFTRQYCQAAAAAAAAAAKCLIFVHRISTKKISRIICGKLACFTAVTAILDGEIAIKLIYIAEISF